MKVGVPKETASGERRVALVPDSTKRLAEAGVEVLVESGAGDRSRIPRLGLRGDRRANRGRRVLRSRRRGEGAAARRRRGRRSCGDGQILIAFLQPLVNGDLVRSLAERRVTAFSMDSIPRITRAQPMDALSSQSTVSGYKGTLIAADHLPKFMPMLTTAAGHDPARAHPHARRGSRRPAGDRHRAEARSRRLRLRRASRREGAGREPRCHVPGAGRRGRRRPGWLRGRALRRPARARAGAHRPPCRRVGRGHHHCTHPRAARAGAHHRRRGARDAAGLRDRRPRGRGGRELRAHAPGRDRHGETASPSSASSTCRARCRCTRARCTRATSGRS